MGGTIEEIDTIMALKFTLRLIETQEKFQRYLSLSRRLAFLLLLLYYFTSLLSLLNSSKLFHQSV